MSVSINAISSIPGTGNQVAAVDGLAIAIGSTAQRLLGVRAAIRLNSTTNNFEATPDGVTYFTFASATGPILSITGTANQIDVSAGVNPVVSIDAAYVGQASITTLGTITTGTWQATPVALLYGGTNAALVASNGGIFYSTATAGAILAGTATARQMLQSGATAAPTWSTATWPATTTINRLLYSSAANTITDLATANNGLLVTSAAGVPSILAGPGTTGQILQANAAAPPSFSSTSYPSTSILGDTIYGSAANTLSILAGNITAVKQYLSQTGTGAVSAAPAWATISGADITGAALTAGNDTNVTLTTGGTPATSLLRAASITAGWTGQLSLARGGTNADTSAQVSNGGIVWSNATQMQILAGTATARQMLQSGASATPAWSTSTYPATNAINTLLFASAANVMSALATANNGVLVTSAGGVPSISSTLPANVVQTTNLIVTVKSQVFTATGAGTYTPSTGMLYCLAVAVGSGGGGGGVANGNLATAGGGGAGGCSIAVFTAATIGASKALSIGAGGAGGVAGNNVGTTGGNTTFGPAGSLLVANGGVGGSGSAGAVVNPQFQAPGGAGGTATTGTINFSGGTGLYGFNTGIVSSGQLMSGSGGASFFGAGAPGTAPSVAGVNAVAYGGGGSGACDGSSTARAGGNGANGVIYIIEWCNQ